jgi:hypothetical protein
MKALRYFLLSFMLWIVVDWGTAGGFRMVYFQTYMPALLLFYIGYPLIFTWLVFGLKWTEKWLFAATLAAIFVVEVLFVHNLLVMNFPVCLATIPLAVAVYAPLTYFPLWIVRREVRKHLSLILFLSLVELAVIVLTTFGSGR